MREIKFSIMICILLLLLSGCSSHSYFDCEEVARKDYGFKNPDCISLSDECLCKDKVIEREETEIERNNSFEIILAKSYSVNHKVFRLKAGES